MIKGTNRRLVKVEYSKKNGKLVATEVYSNGDTQVVKIKYGVITYILKGD